MDHHCIIPLSSLLDISISSVLVVNQGWEVVLASSHLAPAAQTLLPESNAHQRELVKLLDILLAAIQQIVVLVGASVIWPATAMEIVVLMTLHSHAPWTMEVSSLIKY